jgi:hypothetical protein
LKNNEEPENVVQKKSRAAQGLQRKVNDEKKENQDKSRNQILEDQMTGVPSNNNDMLFSFKSNTKNLK